MNIDNVLDSIINKFHIILASAAQAAVFVYHFKTGHDIGSGVQNTLYAYYGFLGAHAFTYQKYPDGSPVPPAPGS
jgi:hypothetical protein